MECISKFDVAAGITLAIFWLYFMFYLGKFGILHSISASGPALRKINKNYQWFFYLWLLAMAAPLVVFLEISGWYFSMIVAMGLLGMTPDYDKGGTVEWMHNISAFLAMGVPMLVMAFSGLWLIAVAFVIAEITLRLAKVKNITTWEEVIAVNLGCIGLMIAY